MLLSWIGFGAAVLSVLALDLLVIRRRTHAVRLAEALGWSALWIGLAAAFGAGVFLVRGRQPALEFFTAYLVEESLSIDNLFVFLVLFGHFQVPEAYRHKVLFWGILGALVMRLAFIVAGVSLIERLHWLMYVFGAILVVSGVRMARPRGTTMDPESTAVLRWMRRVLPLTRGYEGDRFFVRRRGAGLFLTPLFLVLVMVEVTDLVFALDSLPAVLGISRDPFIVYTSNVFAILGLRSLFLALARLLVLFHFLHYGLALVLVFIGVAMLITPWVRIPTQVELIVIGATIALTIAASLAWPERSEGAASPKSR